MVTTNFHIKLARRKLKPGIYLLMVFMLIANSQLVTDKEIVWTLI